MLNLVELPNPRFRHGLAVLHRMATIDRNRPRGWLGYPPRELWRVVYNRCTPRNPDARDDER